MLVLFAIIGIFAIISAGFMFFSDLSFDIAEGAKAFAILIIVIIVLVFALKGCTS